MKGKWFGLLAIVAGALCLVGCEPKDSEACDYGQGATFSIVQPQVYAQAFVQPQVVYSQPFVQQRFVQRQFVQSYAVAPQAVIVENQRFRGRDRGRSRVIVRQHIRY